MSLLKDSKIRARQYSATPQLSNKDNPITRDKTGHYGM